MMITLEEGGLKEERYSENNIIISHSTLPNILLTQLKNMTSWYKVMCRCECCISVKSIHSSLLSCHDNVLKNLKIKVVMRKTEGIMKCPIVYSIHIKVLSCQMISICFKQHMTWKWQQCVHIHNQIMHYHIRNVCFVVVQNVHGLIFQFHNQIRKIQMLSPP